MFSACPCDLKASCKGRREDAVNIVLGKEFCTSNEVRSALVEKGYGDWVIRRSLSFLRSKRCKRIKLLSGVKDKRPLHFRDHGTVFFSDQISEPALRQKIRQLLTRLQSEILEKFTEVGSNFYYFSSYELRKMLPYPGFQVDYSVKRLCNLGFVKMTRIGKTTFFTEPQNTERLINVKEDAMVEDVTEFEVAKKIHELIMNLYPLYMITQFKGTLRPRSSEILQSTGGMSFDLFYKFDKIVENKRFLAIDVYTRVPVSGYIVNSFKKKIEWTENLRERTFGMIVFRNATPNAIQIAHETGIRITHLPKVKIDYGDVRREVSANMTSQRTVLLS